MRGHALEVKQLIGGPDECRLRPVVHFDGTAGVPRERGLEVGQCPERAIYDLRCKRRIQATDRATPELGIEGRRGPSFVARDPLKHSGRDLSGGGYHGAKLTPVAGPGTEIGGLAKCVIP